MTKAELIEAIHHKSQDLSRSLVGEIVDSTFAAIAKAINKEKRFSVTGFGTFSVRKRSARSGRNPQTGAAIKIAASRTVKFKPAPHLKKSL